MNQQPQGKKSLSVVCSRDSLDGAYPSAVLAINAVRMGMDATIYYTFSGLNVIRKGFAKKLKFYPPGAMGAIPGMSQLATGIMKKKIEKAELPELSDLLEMCQLEGVKLIGCHMAASMFELDRDDFIDGVEIANAEQFLQLALDSNLCLFT
jgi:peroxiredoxin family protein